MSKDQKVFESEEAALHKLIADEHKEFKHPKADAQSAKRKKDLEELRVKHGLAYEREHDVDHTIKDLIRPQRFDRFMIDAEEEHYGDSGDEEKPHLNLHPKKHEFEPRVIKAADHTHFFAGKHSV